MPRWSSVEGVSLAISEDIDLGARVKFGPMFCVVLMPLDMENGDIDGEVVDGVVDGM